MRKIVILSCFLVAVQVISGQDTRVVINRLTTTSPSTAGISEERLLRIDKVLNDYVS
ncbi:MAG: hypothetical protein H7Y03_13910, partial [Chitinophagaceae bacterium]|nr:hypothetical protein [Chitinophagaceae bacterium]